MVEFHWIVVTQRYKSVTLKIERFSARPSNLGTTDSVGVSEIVGGDELVGAMVPTPTFPTKRMKNKKTWKRSKVLLVIALSHLLL
jgi:hypothetical protein